MILQRSNLLVWTLVFFHHHSTQGFHILTLNSNARVVVLKSHPSASQETSSSDNGRRSFLTTSTISAAAFFSAAGGLLTPSLVAVPPARAVGPVKVALKPTSYVAKPCPPSKPIPGQQAMKGMRGLCVTVNADLAETPPKNLEKVGVYGFITDAETGDSVLANNPDLSTDAGQFAMIESVSTSDRKVQFEFIAAVPMEKDLTDFDNGIGPLNFESLRIISYPGGEQYGAISPCEMNEFSEECEAWEAENGPYQAGKYMMKNRKAE